VLRDGCGHGAGDELHFLYLRLGTEAGFTTIMRQVWCKS
jgi:hypothetical protein